MKYLNNITKGVGKGLGLGMAITVVGVAGYVVGVTHKNERDEKKYAADVAQKARAMVRKAGDEFLKEWHEQLKYDAEFINIVRGQ